MATPQEIEALKKRIQSGDLTEEEILAALGPEAAEARTARENYLRQRRATTRSGWGEVKPGMIPKMPTITAAEAAARQPTAEIFEIQKEKRAVLKLIQDYRGEDNPLKRMELARDIIKNYQTARATVVARNVGTRGQVLVQRMKSRDALSEAIDKRDEEYGMGGAQASTHEAVGLFRKSVKDQAGAGSLDPGVAENQQFLLQSANEALASIADPGEKARALAALDREMTTRGFVPISTQIQEGRAREAAGEDLVGEPSLRDLVTQTDGFSEREFGQASRINQLEIRLKQEQQAVEEEEKRLGGGIGASTDVFQVYRNLNKELGTSGDPNKDPMLEPFMDQINQLDDMIKTLRRPTFTDEYQRSRAQMMAHPVFDDYMQLRGFMPGQEDLAIKQLVEEAGPVIDRQVAVRRIMQKANPDDPRTAIGKVTSKIPLIGKAVKMSKARKEALRMKSEQSPASTPEAAEARAEALAEAGVEGPSQAKMREDVRSALGIEEGKTVFQQAGISPAVGDQPGQTGGDPTGIPKTEAGEDGSADAEEGAPPPSEEKVALAGFARGFNQGMQNTSAELGGEVPAVDLGEDGSDAKRKRRVDALRGLGPTFGEPSVVT